MTPGETLGRSLKRGYIALVVGLLFSSFQTGYAAGEYLEDVSVGYRYGSQFKEPYVSNGDPITKNIYNLQYVGGYKYGTNFLNIDMLKSDGKDCGALEVYDV